MSEENKTVELEDKELKQVTGGTGGNVSGADGSSTINITIIGMYNRKYYFTVNPEITVYDLKLLYEEREGYDLEFVEFSYCGKMLAEFRTLASYNISNGSEINQEKVPKNGSRT